MSCDEFGCRRVYQRKRNLKVRSKNKTFQSCRYCCVGGSLYRIDSEEGVYYVCEKHRTEKEFLGDVLAEGTEDEFLGSVVLASENRPAGVVTRALNYIRGR